MFKTLGFIVFWCVALNFNLYKVHIFENLIDDDGSNYTIFPWMDDGQVSSSSPIWLLMHVYVALFHIILTSLWIMDLQLSGFHEISHLGFTIMIMINLHHFGEESFLVAIAANGTPLLIMNLIYYYWTRFKMVYFLALVSPVLLEVVLYIKAHVCSF